MNAFVVAADDGAGDAVLVVGLHIGRDLRDRPDEKVKANIPAGVLYIFSSHHYFPSGWEPYFSAGWNSSLPDHISFWGGISRWSS